MQVQIPGIERRTTGKAELRASMRCLRGGEKTEAESMKSLLKRNRGSFLQHLIDRGMGIGMELLDTYLTVKVVGRSDCKLAGAESDFGR